MKCRGCRAAEYEVRRKNHKYLECGLPNVILLGIEVRTCPKCDDTMIGIPRISELHRLIAMTLVRKSSRLTPAEVCFLRKSLGWSQADFAEHLHVDPSTVSRWESKKNPQVMGEQHDLLLRLAVVVGQKIEDYKVDEMIKTAVEKPSTKMLQANVDEEGWHIDIAA